MLTDLIAFITARLDEDEQTACAAAPGPWSIAAHDRRSILDPTGEYVMPSIGARREWPSRADAAHIARHDPMSVLREDEVKRRLLDMASILSRPDTGSAAKFGRRVLGLLALPYDQHPDYQAEWAP